MSCSIVSSVIFVKSPLSSPDIAPSCSSPSPVSPLKLRRQKPIAMEFIQSSSSPRSAFSPFSSLKRKRPTKIRIPVPLIDFPLTSPALDPWRNGVEIEGDGFSVCCKKGRKGKMEDRYSADVNLDGNPKNALFGIFDGHGGSKASEFAAENLGKNIVGELGHGEVEFAVRRGYLKTDSEFLEEDRNGGCCCLTALIRDGEVVVSNAGDCRAVICRGGSAEALTVDHRPGRADEKARVESKGGFVDFHGGMWRVNGCLGVSRGIGDRHLKEWVIPEPETRVVRIEPDYEFLILGSDGLWDKVSNQEAVDVARLAFEGGDGGCPLMACKKLVEISRSRGSLDDISVMIVHLGHYID